jgi:hypothetical protein
MITRDAQHCGRCTSARSSLAVGGLAGLCLAAMSASAEPPMVRLIDRELHVHIVQLTAIEAGYLGYIDDTGLIRREPLSEYTAILPAEPDSESSDVGVVTMPMMDLGESGQGWLETIDGERWRGRAVAQDDDGLRWEHPVLGPLELSMERVRQVRLAGSLDAMHSDHAGDTDSQTQDLVWLANGDRVEGFVESIWPGVRVEVREQFRDFAPDAVASIELANTPEAVTGMLVRLEDGSVVRAERLVMDERGKVAIGAVSSAKDLPESPPSGASVLPSMLEWSQIKSVVIEASRIVPLAGLRVKETRALGGRPWASPMRLERSEQGLPWTPDLILPGPMEVEWMLPSEGASGKRRVAFEAVMPPGQWTWGDCEIVVIADGAELVRARVNGRTPTAKVNVAVPAGVRGLSVRSESGRFGPVQDGLRLKGAVLVVPGRPGTREAGVR